MLIKTIVAAAAWDENLLEEHAALEPAARRLVEQLVRMVLHRDVRNLLRCALHPTAALQDNRDPQQKR